MKKKDQQQKDTKTYEEMIRIIENIQKKLQTFNAQKQTTTDERLLRYQ